MDRQRRKQESGISGTRKNNTTASSSSSGNISPWVSAIQSASSFALDQQNEQASYNKNGGSSYHDGSSSTFTALENVDYSLAYLNILQDILLTQGGIDNNLERPPQMPPPPFEPPKQQSRQQTPPFYQHNGPKMDATSYSINGNPTTEQSSSFAYMSGNPYASIATNSDDEEDDYFGRYQQRQGNRQEQQHYNCRDYDDEAGDTPNAFFISQELDTLRLLIRLHTSQSDLFGCKGRLLSMNRQWFPGVAALQSAIGAVSHALRIADGEISKYFMDENTIEGGTTTSFNLTSEMRRDRLRRRYQLQQDADIVHVSIQHIVQEKERYSQAANRQVGRLKRILRPQWEARDAIKSRMGQGRWTNNPEPKYDYAEKRRQHEEELRILKEALEQLASQDTDQLSNEAKELQEKLLDSYHHKKRYNGQRPSPNVNRLEGYPDATEYGWNFTGSSDNVVEFFEKEIAQPENGQNVLALVKLDFYFTTGTVKTSMDHPTQGKTQLFAKQVSPDIYCQILENPRVHTNSRYQTRDNKKKRSQRGRGGQNGRGRNRNRPEKQRSQ